MKRVVLSKKGLEKISKLQDKYKFQTTFEIIEPEAVIDFLKDLRQAAFLGLSVEEEDSDWINNTLDVLTS